MKWVKIKKAEINEWNEKLKATHASFFQYPYYASGYTFFLFSKPLYIKLVNDQQQELGYSCILNVGAFPFKAGLIIRGPVFFKTNVDHRSSLIALKKFAVKERYTFLRVNANEPAIEELLNTDSEFEHKDYFPSYKGSQGIDLNIYYKPFDELLKSFRTDCRNKIRFANEKNYLFEKVKTSTDLEKVYDLFVGLGSKKKFSYRPLKSYTKIFKEGIKHELCSVYTASLDGRIICAAFIVKDSQSFTYFSGALELQNIPAKYSPANNLHYLIMQDCFYKEDRKIYNLSYSPRESGVYMFKTSFRPEEICKPGFYTYVINRKIAERIFSLQGKSISAIRTKLRSIIKLFNK
ncbi:GNAT family N-acetyltransferase [Panacibacter ginsenosidivorans]|uniref:GNAT family N-acetyltransferase n=1 Tax=Panacibacter ginsenosidivorans TaxID=1813871 RepID=A0A5B8VDH5_9BACT|nr:GNAT family N-acetyltransferase [Panacibacter ginsenosidivorans]QEC69105.1 GNAT family N-acetyltransferase [Panacibacter ginsenosidivorans]